jgi:hypothetical protein
MCAKNQMHMQSIAIKGKNKRNIDRVEIVFQWDLHRFLILCFFPILF